jgi:hypothetical protein
MAESSPDQLEPTADIGKHEAQETLIYIKASRHLRPKLALL